MDIVGIYEVFPTNDHCITHLEKVRWGDKPKCPYCKSPKVTPRPKEKRHHCNNCNTSFSVTVRTIFHHTHLPLQKWFLAITLVLNAKKGIAARQLGRDLHVNKDTAWRMAMKIRDAMMEREQRIILQGLVEMDETYVGGKPRKGTGPHKRGRGTKKIPVVGMVERDKGKGKIKVEVIKNRKLDGKRLKALVRKNVDIKNSTLFTDEYKGYLGIKTMMPHKVINHSEWYVDGDVHTNTIESFWALLKRGIIGQYHKVSLSYLAKYIDEFSYRWNNRKTDSDDFFFSTLQRAVRGI
ncbi:MAG: IS1595 family transposase [Desulfobacterales bacterium]|nr:IS1595 family transposase [Desulfobacterales bacterium]